jgi:hypothetical protein
MVAHISGRLLGRQFWDGKLGIADLEQVRLLLVSVVDQEPPVVTANLSPEDVIVRDTVWCAIGP